MAPRARLIPGDKRLHVVAGPPLGRRLIIEPRVIEICRIVLVRRERRFLLDQPAAWKNRVGDRTGELAGTHAPELDLRPVTARTQGHCGRLEYAFEAVNSPGC